MLTEESEVKRLIRDKILADKKSLGTSLNYAVDYCLAAEKLSGEALRVQCLYILNNITHWRHPDAKEVRSHLKSFTKGGGSHE
jgi:hypothetical protein